MIPTGLAGSFSDRPRFISYFPLRNMFKKIGRLRSLPLEPVGNRSRPPIGARRNMGSGGQSLTTQCVCLEPISRGESPPSFGFFALLCSDRSE